MKPCKKIILTYDYELFFGKSSGTIQNSLLKPTEALRLKFKEKGIKATFFVDVLMMRSLFQAQTSTSLLHLEQIEEQLKALVRDGHRLELHLHPHWIDAKENKDGTWNFDDFTHYSLSSLSEKEVIELFQYGVDYLNNLCRTIESNYNVVAFRAGGWAVQPFTHLRSAFQKTGIKIDSSVGFGAYGQTQYAVYDFKKAPQCPFYTFSDDVLKVDKQGEFIEIPISSFRRTILQRVFDKIYRFFYASKTITDGTHQRDDLKDSIIDSTYTMFNHTWNSPLSTLINIKRYPHSLIVMIDHPKDFSHIAFNVIDMMAKRFKFINYLDVIS